MGNLTVFEFLTSPFLVRFWLFLYLNIELPSDRHRLFIHPRLHAFAVPLISTNLYRFFLYRLTFIYPLHNFYPFLSFGLVLFEFSSYLRVRDFPWHSLLSIRSRWIRGGNNLFNNSNDKVLIKSVSQLLPKQNHQENTSMALPRAICVILFLWLIIGDFQNTVTEENPTALLYVAKDFLRSPDLPQARRLKRSTTSPSAHIYSCTKCLNFVSNIFFGNNVGALGKRRRG